MQSKIIVLVALILALIPVSFSATQQNVRPQWIRVAYADLEQKQVSEYQLVTVAVKETNLWFSNGEYRVELDYDSSQLELVNIIYNDGLFGNTQLDDQTVTTTDNNFEVKYQFYLKPNADITESAISVTKYKDNEVSNEANFTVNCQSQTTPRVVEFGNVKLDYAVTKFERDNESVNYEASFTVIENAKRQPFTLTVKENNMKVSESDLYAINVTTDDGQVREIDDANFSITLAKGGKFKLAVTVDTKSIKAKDNRFEFLVFLKNNERFIRLEPTYFKSDLIVPTQNLRAIRFISIKVIIAAFFILLFIGYLYTSRKRTIDAENHI